MLRLIFIVLVLFCAFVAGLAFALNHWFGWKGMVAFPIILLALLWIGKTVLVSLFKNFALGLFSRKAAALRGANLQVHSVTAVAAPVDSDDETEEDEADEDATDEAAKHTSTTDEEPGDDEPDDDEPEEPREWYDLDITIIPTQQNQERLWEPGEFVFTCEPVTKLDQLEDKEVGHTHNVVVWKSSGFTSDDEGKYQGPQRLKLTVSLKPGIQTAWLQYYNLSLGSVTLPPWKPLGNLSTSSTSAAP